jgi:hypothetical protein
MYLVGGLAPFSQYVRLLLIPLASKVNWENDLIIAPIDLTNSKIQPTWTLPIFMSLYCNFSQRSVVGFSPSNIASLVNCCTIIFFTIIGNINALVSTSEPWNFQ